MMPAGGFEEYAFSYFGRFVYQLQPVLVEQPIDEFPARFREIAIARRMPRFVQHVFEKSRPRHVHFRLREKIRNQSATMICNRLRDQQAIDRLRRDTRLAQGGLERIQPPENTFRSNSLAGCREDLKILFAWRWS